MKGKGKKRRSKAPIALTALYDRVTRGKDYDESREISSLANDYFEEFKRQGGGQGKSEIISDFKIVACATLGKMDAVISADERTMLSNIAKTAYGTVNRKRGLSTPQFWSYESFKKIILGR